MKSIGIAALALLVAAAAFAEDAKTYDATYTATLSSIPAK